MRKSLLATLTATALVSAAQAQAITLVQWNFNSVVPDATTSSGTLVPNLGNGTASLVGGTTSTFASGDASGGSSDPATGDDSGWQTTAYAAQSTGNKTRGTQYAVSTLGYQSISVSWDHRHSNTSARHVQFQYSTNGTTFTDFGLLFPATAGDTWFNNRSVNLSSISGADNNPDFAFRVVAAFDPLGSGYVASTNTSSYGTGGTWRFDMVTVMATPVPEPGALALMLAGLAAVGFVARRRG